MFISTVFLLFLLRIYCVKADDELTLLKKEHELLKTSMLKLKASNDNLKHEMVALKTGVIQLKIVNNELKISNENLNEKVIALENDLMQMKIMEQHSATGNTRSKTEKSKYAKQQLKTNGTHVSPWINKTTMTERTNSEDRYQPPEKVMSETSKYEKVLNYYSIIFCIIGIRGVNLLLSNLYFAFAER